ncbi:porin [Rubellimicrobium sp. CFH 75288]|uniref:porin n=1 Tax=Rubellimicrobium sp. CFH 75288 TaxID=2697034 RepID=UPI0014127D98|nr:porin [Rubellimicrobium sp. CFH 75288]NAZ38037.1 porin [Rubellimicrobium sp. CFH 75288]
MKRILLASASIVAFAGAAAAQNITFGGTAELGFNDEEEDGFFYSADLDVTFTTTLDNGLVASATFTLPIASNNLGNTNIGVDDNFVLAIESEGFGGLFFGDTAFAAETRWDPGFAMASDNFSEQDNETVLRGDGVFGDWEFSVSGIVADADNDRPGTGGSGRDYLDQISLGGAGSFGNFVIDFAYQEESQIASDRVGLDESEEGVYDSANDDFNPNEILAAAVGTTFGGADLKFAVARDLTAETTSYGVLARYPFGPVTLTGSYTFEPDFDEDSWRVQADYASGPVTAKVFYESEVGEEDWGIEAGYALDDLTNIYVGYIDADGAYAGARFGIGSNAYLEASYSEFSDAGPTEFRQGTTLLVGLTF